MTLEEMVKGVRGALALSDDADVLAAIQSAGAELQRLRTVEQDAQGRVQALESDLTTAQERVKALEPEAADGRQYRDDLIAEALGEGVRAYGDKFAHDTYATMLRAAPLSVIKQMRSDWATVGDARLPGGRASTDSGEQAPAKPATTDKRTAIPSAAYKA